MSQQRPAFVTVQTARRRLPPSHAARVEFASPIRARGVEGEASIHSSLVSPA